MLKQDLLQGIMTVGNTEDHSFEWIADQSSTVLNYPDKFREFSMLLINYNPVDCLVYI